MKMSESGDERTYPGILFKGIAADTALRRIRELELQRDELVTALRDLLECHTEGNYVQPDQEVIEQGRAAIAKATELDRYAKNQNDIKTTP
jgi:hypothetical protein